MDPQAMMMNDAGFHSANAPVPYNLAEIWPFPMQSGGKLGFRRLQFGRQHHSTLGQLQFLQDDDDTNSNNAANANPKVPVDEDEPMLLDQKWTSHSDSGGARKRRDQDHSAKLVSTTTAANAMSDCESKRLKTLGSTDENRESKAEGEGNSNKPVEESKKPTEHPKQDYIHVRARRGQATDSHSLAERARREKISERMKILQDLVPGCNKVIGKALVLDEIINYIQSLQRQVEFLSMKLEAVNTKANPSIEGFSAKDFGQQSFDVPGVAFGSQPTREYSRGSSPEWLHMQIGSGFDRTT